ncbi:MAG: hypothetical protein GY749_38555 [Desulfobacteraceae bacterium]|nr:hypothetical protein [Desulfobacteraceae bacterium]
MAKTVSLINMKGGVGKEFELLTDLAKLFKKYSTEAFENLALILSDKKLCRTVSIC